MKQIILLVSMMIMLLSSSSDATVLSMDNEIFEPSKFVISETEFAIYELITPEANKNYVESLAYSLFGFREVIAEEVQGRYVVNSGSKSFEVDSRDGSIFYADHSRIWNVTLGNDLPSPGTCHEIAESWLENNGKLPDNAVFANIGATNASAYHLDDGRLMSKIIQYHVNYEFTHNDIPIHGGAAQISVLIGDGQSAYDRIVGLDWNWREPKADAYAMANLIEYESILEAYGIRTQDVVNHRLVYTVYDVPDNNKLLYPIWEIEVIEYDEQGFENQFILAFDATVFDPKVEISNPASAITARPGQSITFDCNARFGTPPYIYQWHSNSDGDLSTAKSFSTSSLNLVLKKDVAVPHAISVKVIDSEGRVCSDVVAVTVERRTTSLMDMTVFIAAGAFAVLLGALIVARRKKAKLVLLFLLMLFSAFFVLPVSVAGSNHTGVPRIVPNAPTGAYDDGIKEVGIEWVGMSHAKRPLRNTQTNIEGFYNWMGLIGGYNQEFNWGEYSAWEKDFKDVSFGGIDTEWIDAVDFVYYQDHGGPDGVSFTSKHDQTSLRFSKMRLGDGDLDWIVFDACSPLAWENKDGDNVFERWAPTLQGVHLICSFATGSHNVQTRGSSFGLYMTGSGAISPTTIVQAWFRATLETESSNVKSAVLYASKSANPLNPQQDDPINDHLFGFGYVCSDPTPGSFSWIVCITSNC